MYKDVRRELQKITPTFSMILNRQIGDCMDAINNGEIGRAYEIEKTLVSALKPEDRNELQNNHVKHIDSQLTKVGKPKSQSFYRGLIETSTSKERILLDNVRVLFQAIMEKLHEGKYLEKTREVREGHE